MDELDEILPYIKGKKCVLFIGAGLSRIAGCADWGELVREMVQDEIIKTKLDTPQPVALSNEEVLGFCFREFKNQGQTRKFWGYVSKSLSEVPTDYQNKYMPIIKKIKNIAPFPQVVITTNIDGLLEKTKLFELDKVFFKLEEFNLVSNPEGIFHIHGYIHDIENSVFIRDKYLSRYQGNGNFRSFLIKIAKNNSILFIGSGLEQSIRDILLKARDESIKHFLLVSEDNTAAYANRMIYESELNVKVIRYGPRVGFPSLLSAWIDKNFPVTTLAEPEEDPTKALQV